MLNEDTVVLHELIELLAQLGQCECMWLDGELYVRRRQIRIARPTPRCIPGAVSRQRGRSVKEPMLGASAVAREGETLKPPPR